MAEYTIIGPEGERIIECPDGRCLHTPQMVSAELNRLAAENAALRELYGAACREILAEFIGDDDMHQSAIDDHFALRKKHADVLKEWSK